ncbi:uncharacterized protein L3040_006298 [Drepanopeziza brunnea f. sp. 'multigermtubi']|uniref:GDSL-like Lipase/Acylhydrolase n=1 Tax=Marssonina brunnea f. sp. multigermtubi (strain MB_m1) TaxID=1072389 RepID=K1WUR5_MARBU|nr:GDSL-like Lipase/Acylhydrolase [Drepanopeziza brunnea f. sp. 'multigermtubi' MB_m1]EKD16796.1 GDSL-like Lipase/Acylhydrolase [Drepanopeziza brunnea f. sp. 'multigermtubi' MB_m1]KAJ5040649.1 hypothetical protein L3040_006298 [Drepanopeziza brunnea f. sp. 'multigermtubi']
MHLSIPDIFVQVLALASIVLADSVFLLAGDSTTHEPGGWGDGFLNYTLEPAAFGFNYGASGAISTTYLQGSNFSQILRQIAEYKSTASVFVTFQFGHNDQKVPEYKAAFNGTVYKFVDEITTAGATPILITPLTRRAFSGGKVIENLADEANVVRAAAAALGDRTRMIDLNLASTTYVNAIGNEAAQVYNMAASDKTHLNPWGTIVFGRLVSDLLVAKYPDLASITRPNATLSFQLANGIPA